MQVNTPAGNIVCCGAIPFIVGADVGQLVLGHGGEVVAQKQATHGMLHAAAQFDQIEQDFLGRHLSVWMPALAQ